MHWAQIPLGQLIMLSPFNIENQCFGSSIRNCIAYANETNVVNKDFPIRGVAVDLSCALCMCVSVDGIRFLDFRIETMWP